MLVVEVIGPKTLMVIHYTVPGSEDYDGDKDDKTSAVVSGASASSPFIGSEKGIVKEENTTVDPTKDKVELLDYEQPGVAIYTGQEAIKRARGRVGETDYNVLNKNCESFVNWVITDHEETNQGELVKVVAAAATVVGGLVAISLAGSKDKKDSEKKKKLK